MPVSPARTVAFAILMDVEVRESYAVDLLHSERAAKLSSADHGLCMEIVMGVLRWRSRLDHEIAAQAGGAPRFKKLDAEVLTALRMAVYQMGWLDRVPERAVIHESVELVKNARKRSAAPFVNAVLRGIADRSEDLQPAIGSLESPAEIADHFAHPVWMVERWIRQFGMDHTVTICRANQQTSEVHLRFLQENQDETERELTSCAIAIAPGRLLAKARRVISGDVTSTAAFREGRVAIQDEASQLVAMLLGNGQCILDCCAAPGGKTSVLAERNPTGKVVAVELHEHRLRLMKRLVRAPNVELVQADITNMPVNAEFDRILADVPCSGTGTLARNPEIKWRLIPTDLVDLHQRQVAILAAALDRLAPKGQVLYSTCSLEAKENVEVVNEVLDQRPGTRILDCRERLVELKRNGELVWPSPESLCDGMFMKLLPGVHPGDGFFAALIEKI